MSEITNDTARAAAFLVAKQRLDARRSKKGKGPKCNPPNRVCGDRCIPPSWKCRVKGEGTDSHSRVVAGDPLAGAASIQRGQARLRRGLQTGNLADIQGGRAAIERGIVKAVPGQNIKQKQKLRSTVSKALLPVASTIFGIWAIRQGHEGIKVLVPQYRSGIGQQIEQSANNAISWGLDQVPVFGPRRIAQRRVAGLEAQRLGRAVTRSFTRDPSASTTNFSAFTRASDARRGAFSGLDTQINASYQRLQGRSYNDFRSEFLGDVVGARNSDGQSIYAEFAAADHLARRFSFAPDTVINSKGIPSRTQVVNRVSASLISARSSMRADMATRGLNPRNIDDVDRYATIALGNAMPRMQGLTPDNQANAENNFRGLIRQIVLRPSNLRDEASTMSIADDMFTSTQESFNTYFSNYSAAIRENTAATSNVVATGNTGIEIRSTLIATANRVKTDIGLGANYQITGGNHAELVLQKLYYERVQPGSFNGNRRSTWLASQTDETARNRGPSDSLLRNAARDMGWQGNDIDGAVSFLQQNGFRRLAPRPRTRERQIGSQRANAQPLTGTPRQRRARPPRTREQIIQMLVRAGRSPEAAANEADSIIARRSDSPEYDLPPRVRAFLEHRADLKEASRLGKPCGASHIPKTHDCRKGQGPATSPRERQLAEKTATPKEKAYVKKTGMPMDTLSVAQAQLDLEKDEKKKEKTNKAAKVAVAAGIVAVGVIGVTVAFDINRLNKGSGLPQPPSFKQTVSKIKKANQGFDTGAALDKYYEDIVIKEGWKPGQLVYTRYTGGKVVIGGNEDHYGIYVGKMGGIHQFAHFGGEANGIGGASLEGTGPGGNFRPYIFSKVPETMGGGTGKFDEQQLRYRIGKSLQQPMRYDMLENNCEAWARMIVEGTPRSTQSDRISAISKTLYKLDNMFGKADLRGATSIKQESKRLDLWWRRINGDVTAAQELNVFTELVNLGKRTDAEGESSGLPPIEALLPKGITDPEAVQRIKMYLMLAISSSSKAQREANARKDSLALTKFRARTTKTTSPAKKGKPCGESFIPKSHECRQKRTSQVAKVALTAGAIAAGAYALKKAKVTEFHTGLGTSDPFAPVRKRRFTWMQKNQKPMSSKEIANVFEDLKAQKGVIPNNVQALQDFVRARNITNNPAIVLGDMEQGLAKTSIGKDSKKIMKQADLMIKLGAFDGLASTASDSIYVRSSRKDNAILNPDPGEMVAASARFMDRRAEAQGRQRPSMTERFKRLYSVARNTSNGDVHEAILHIHEISHKVHFQASLNRGGSDETIIRGIIYDPVDRSPFLDKAVPSKLKSNSTDFDAFYRDVQQRKKLVVNQLEAAVSEYGRSDVRSSRTETFAELSVLYVTQGSRFKREFPLAYAWVDDIWTEARQARD
jgi:hypothetical protein